MPLAGCRRSASILTGDVCVNGPYNYVGDGDVTQWIQTLDATRKLGAKVVLHRSWRALDGCRTRGSTGVLQGAAQAGRLAHGAQAPNWATLRANAQIARFIGESEAGWDPFPSQVAKVYAELTGKQFACAEGLHHARLVHAHAHGQT